MSTIYYKIKRPLYRFDIKIFSSHLNLMTLAAWGNIIDTRFYLGDALYDIQENLESEQWAYRGTLTKQGNPRHPLYMKSGEEFKWFPVADYAANWRFGDF